MTMIFNFSKRKRSVIRPDLICAAIASALLAVAQPASAALIVSGDTNLLRQTRTNPGNAQFLLNLAGNGIVVLHEGEFSSFVTTDLSFVLGEAAIPHFGLSFDAPITAGDLVGASLYLSYINETGWTAGEASLLTDFVRSGGTVLLAGDNFGFAQANGAINALAAAMGSDMSIVDASWGEFPGAIAIIAEDNAFTAGTASLRYIASSSVVGGRGLYAASDANAYIMAYDPLAAVPEPKSWALFIAGFGLLGTALRHRRSSERCVPSR